MDAANLRRVAGWSAAAVAVLQAATAVLSLRKGRRDFADAAWGPGLAAVSMVSALAGHGHAGRRRGLAGLTTAWAVRLEYQMLTRLRRSEEEDPRYTEFLQGDRVPAVLVKVFLTQGVSQLIVSAPIQLAAASSLPRTGRRWLAPAGLVLMAGGAVVEALADHQKTRYSLLDKETRPDVLDTGLWAWSRHPNYLGDSLVWDGAWLPAAASRPGLLTLPAPRLMTYLLMVATGAKRTEQHMQDRPGYRDYQQRVPFFFPTGRPHGSVN